MAIHDSVVGIVCVPEETREENIENLHSISKLFRVRYKLQELHGVLTSLVWNPTCERNDPRRRR
jgi:hypothetical protein